MEVPIIDTYVTLPSSFIKCPKQTRYSKWFHFPASGDIRFTCPHQTSLLRAEPQSLKNQVGQNSEGEKAKSLQGCARGTRKPPGTGTAETAGCSAFAAASPGKGLKHSTTELAGEPKTILVACRWLLRGSWWARAVAAVWTPASELHLPRDTSPTTYLGPLCGEAMKVGCEVLLKAEENPGAAAHTWHTEYPYNTLSGHCPVPPARPLKHVLNVD